MATLAEILRAETMDRGQRTLSDLGLDDLGQQRRAAVQMLAAQMAQRGDIEGARLLAEAADMDQSMIPTIDPNQVLGGALAPQMAQVRDAIARFIEQDKPFLGLGFDPDMTDMTDVQRQVDMLVAEASRLGVDPEVARALVLNQVYPLLRQGAETGFFNRGDMTARLAQALGMSNVRDEQGYMPTMGEIGTIAALASLIPFGLGGAAGLGGSIAGRGVSALSALFRGAAPAALPTAAAAAPAAAPGAGSLATSIGSNVAGGAAMSAGMGLAAPLLGGADDAAKLAAGGIDDAAAAVAGVADDLPFPVGASSPSSLPPFSGITPRTSMSTPIGDGGYYNPLASESATVSRIMREPWLPRGTSASGERTLRELFEEAADEARGITARPEPLGFTSSAAPPPMGIGPVTPRQPVAAQGVFDPDLADAARGVVAPRGALGSGPAPRGAAPTPTPIDTAPLPFTPTPVAPRAIPLAEPPPPPLGFAQTPVRITAVTERPVLGGFTARTRAPVDAATQAPVGARDDIVEGVLARIRPDPPQPPFPFTSTAAAAPVTASINPTATVDDVMAALLPARRRGGSRGMWEVLARGIVNGDEQAIATARNMGADLSPLGL